MSHARTPFQTACVGLAALVLAATVGLSSAAVATADPIADAQARAIQVQAQVSALQNDAEKATEQYDLSRSRYESVSVQVGVSKRTIAKLTAEKSALQGKLDTRAVALYREGPLNFLNTLLGARTFADFDAAYQILTNLNQRDADNVAQLKAAKEQADVAQTRLLAQQAQAGQQQHAMSANAEQVKAQYAASQNVLAQADATVKQLIAQKQAAEAAAARAEAARVLAAQAEARRLAREAAASAGGSGGGSSRSRHHSGGSVSVNVPTGSGKGLKAVAYAESRIGCPYVWAASGPNEFDCSGLTMWAYGKAGVSLPHYSRAQIDCGQRVSRSRLQPGDLVFFGSPIHHVGMYVGGGDFIEAPYSGVDVRISRLSNRDDFAGACRP